MKILVCRVAWMPHYRSDSERAEFGGRHIIEGGLPHESLNFLPVDGTYYGFVHNQGHKINLLKLGGKAGDESVTGVLVVFCARQRETGHLLVTGWYRNATVYHSPSTRNDPNDPHQRQTYFTTQEATLVPESERYFRIPRARPKSNIGGIGMSQIWYGLNEDPAKAFREILYDYTDPRSTLTRQETVDITQQPQQVVEWRQRRLSERIERRAPTRKFITDMGYKCEACGWSIDEEEKEVWGASFELHHLEPMHLLQDNDQRTVRPEDFAVLCASCHRAIHRTEFVTDVKKFARKYL